MKVGIPILALTAWVAFAEPEQHGTSTNKSSTGADSEFFQCDLYREKLFAAKMDTCMADFNVQTEKLKTQQIIYESKANDKMKELFLDFQKYFNEQFVDFKEEFVDFRKHMDERFDELTDSFNARFDETGEEMTFYVTVAIYFCLILVMLGIPSSHGVPFGDYVWMTYKHMRDSHDLIEIISLVVVPILAMYALPRGYHAAMLFAMTIVISCVIHIWQMKKYPPQQQPQPPQQPPVQGHQQQGSNP